MKTWMKGLAIGILSLSLAACGNGEQNETGKSELTLEDVFNKAQEASENAESMHIDMDMKQKFSVPGFDEAMETEMEMKIDMVQEPFAMHQSIEMNIPEMGEMKTELYVNEKEMLMKNPAADEWLNLPMDSFDSVMESLNANVSTNVDYASLSGFIEDFEFEQDDDMYVLKLKAESEGFTKLIEQQLASAGLTGGFAGEELEVLKDMKVNEFTYEIYIDRKTFNTPKYNLLMDMELTIEGETMHIMQDVEAEISQINELDEIVIPKAVLDSVAE